MAKPLPWLNPAVWTGGTAPAAALLVSGVTGGLGANPISTALNQLGLLGLIFLIASLACTPLQLVFGWTWPIRIRRTLGLLAFGYVTTHFLTWLVLDQQLSLGTVLKDLVKRPFITVGFTAWLLLLPLAWTSTDAAVRRLGFVRWKRLHRLAYVCGGLGVVHFIWRVKKDLSEPLTYAVVLGSLFALRWVYSAQKKSRAAKAKAPATR